MINTSNEYKDRIMNERKFYLSANIKLVDNTNLILNDSDIMQGGMEFEDATSGNSSFQIGAAIINKHTLTLDNKNGSLDDYDFDGATVVPYVGLQLSETIERLKKGVYTVDESKAIGNLVILECLDNMHKFERPFKAVSISFPTTAINLINVICTYCGVFVGTSTFTNSSYIIQERPIDDALSCLDIISYIAQSGGNFARCNTDGALEIKWYDMTAFEQSDNLDGGTFDSSMPYASGDDADGGNFTDYNSGDSIDGGTFLQTNKYHHLFNFGSTPTVSVDDVVITGIKVENTDSENGFSSIYGSDGYVLSITNNPLIQSQSDANIVVNLVGAKIVGMKFRPFSASLLSDPSIESGDPIYLSVRSNKGYNTYQSFITNSSYKVNSREQISNNAESPSKNSSTTYSAETKAVIEARKKLQNQLNAYDLAMKQFNSLMANAMGYYPTSVKQADGSQIDYMHDKPTLAESQIVWKKTIDGFATSIDGGQTWISGMTADGNIIAKTLSVIGINAEWIKVLTSFTVGTNFSVNALGEMIAKKGTIGRFVLSNSGLKSNAMELLDDDVNPLIWLKSADGSEQANYEGSLTYLRHSNNGIRQTVLVDTRPEYIHGIEFTKETINTNSDQQGRTYEEVQYTTDGISKFSEDDNPNYTMTILGHTIFFSDDGLYINEKHGNSIIFDVNGMAMYSADGSMITTSVDGMNLVNFNGVYANGRNIGESPSEISQMLSDIAAIKQRLGLT